LPLPIYAHTHHFTAQETNLADFTTNLTTDLADYTDLTTPTTPTTPTSPTTPTTPTRPPTRPPTSDYTDLTTPTTDLADHADYTDLTTPTTDLADYTDYTDPTTDPTTDLLDLADRLHRPRHQPDHRPRHQPDHRPRPHLTSALRTDKETPDTASSRRKRQPHTCSRTDTQTQRDT
jgi:hypothetical protein